MPWSTADAHRHKRGMTEREAGLWAKTANAARKHYGDDATAIRVANSVVDSSQRNAWRSHRRG
jgi:hypothetical protein